MNDGYKALTSLAMVFVMVVITIHNGFDWFGYITLSMALLMAFYVGLFFPDFAESKRSYRRRG